MSRGVPQGSCLSPLFFNIYVRDLPAASSADTWQFADDVTQSEVADTVDSIVSKLTATYHQTKQFCQSKHLEINPSKTQFIIFKTPAKKIADDIELTIDSVTVKVERQVKILGMTLDRHLTFKNHISNVVNTCNGLIGVLRKVVHRLPRKLCKLFYTAIIRSNLEYASALLVPVAKTHLEKLDIVQRKAARLICHVPADSHAEPLLNELGLLPLQDRRVQHLLSIVTACIEHKSHPNFNQNFFQEFSRENELCLPVTKTVFGKKRFSCVGAAFYNDASTTIQGTHQAHEKGSASQRYASKNKTTDSGQASSSAFTTING